MKLRNMYQRRESYFWLKYWMVRDGASTVAFLQNLRGARYTVMSLETLEGEIFGALFLSAHVTLIAGCLGLGKASSGE